MVLTVRDVMLPAAHLFIKVLSIMCRLIVSRFSGSKSQESKAFTV